MKSTNLTFSFSLLWNGEKREKICVSLQVEGFNAISYGLYVPRVCTLWARSQHELYILISDAYISWTCFKFPTFRSQQIALKTFIFGLYFSLKTNKSRQTTFNSNKVKTQMIAAGGKPMNSSTGIKTFGSILRCFSWTALKTTLIRVYNEYQIFLYFIMAETLVSAVFCWVLQGITRSQRNTKKTLESSELRGDERLLS